MEHVSTLPKDFNYEIYKLYNKDLEHLTESDAINHFIHFGINENRRYSILPFDFNYKVYLELNKDIKCVTEEDAKNHYTDFGYKEGRPYVEIKENNEIFFDKKQMNEDTFKQFIEIYKTNQVDIDKEPKVKFRYICFYYLNYMKQFTIPVIKQNLDWEAVVIEFREYPHLEFIIRNNILKLGNKWSFTIICGNKNYTYMQKMCKTISPYIKVIKVNYDNLVPSTYSEFMASKDFWKLLKGRQIIIYQEDSLIFRTNIENFMYYDYIGAPWNADNNANNSKVGNGGFSLRTRRIMEAIIDKRSMKDTPLNSHTIDYMKRTNSFVTPEDVYFSKNMEDLNIGRIAPVNIAKKFSMESIFCEDVLAGHNFWLCDPLWEKKISKYNIFQFKPNFNLSNLEHRGGWKYILQELEKYHFFSDNSNVDFFDVVEQFFLWKGDFVCANRWAGIIHCTPKTPNYLKDLNIDLMFQNQNFIKSLKNCVFLISLSPYITNFLKKKINIELKMNIEIYTLYHPVFSNKIPEFTISSYLQNDEKYLLQIGQQLRKISTIYFIPSSDFKKMWLTGCKDFSKMSQLLEQEMDFLDLDRTKIDTNVKMYYTETFKEYDNLLSKNIVIINLYDAAANNTILECIVRNTPIIVNKIEGVMDYLGEDYPLYYENVEEIPSLLDIKKLKEAHLYLKNMNKKKFTIDYFIHELYDLVWKHFLHN